MPAFAPDQFLWKIHVMPADASCRHVAEALFEDNEEFGDFVTRMLAQENRHPVLSIWHNIGRAFHRDWIAGSVAAALPIDPYAREALVTQLVITGDVCTLRLLRRDFKLSVEPAQAVMSSIFAKLPKAGLMPCLMNFF